MPVFFNNPVFRLVLMSPLSPSPEHIPHPVIQLAEYLRRYDRSVIIRPADNDGVQSVNEILLIPSFRSFYHVTNFSNDIINRFLRWLYKEFSIIFTEVPAQKVKAVVAMIDMCLLIR